MEQDELTMLDQTGTDKVSEINQFAVKGGLIRDMLFEQINQTNIASNQPDFLDTIKSQANHLLVINDGLPENTQIIKQATLNLHNNIFSTILNKYSISEDEIETDLELVTTLIDKTEALYYFDVVDRYNNLLNFVNAYIEQNTNTLIETFKKDFSKKDLIVSNMRKTIDTFNNCVLILSVDDIIDMLVVDEYTTDNFFNLLFNGNEETWVAEEIRDMFDNLELPQDFIKYYLSPLLDDIESRTMIVSSVTNNLITLHKKEDR